MPPFRAFGSLFLPAQSGSSIGSAADVIEADERWVTASTTFDGLTAAVWGRLPVHPSPARRLVAFAIRRETALARMRLSGARGRLRIVRVHRLPPPYRVGRLKTLVRGTLMGGLAVEVGPAGGTTTIAVVAEAVGLPDAVRLRLRPSGDGSAHARVDVMGAAAFLRIAADGGLRDLGRNASALRALGAANVAATPRLIGEGSVRATAWTLETMLPGRSPQHVTPTILSGIVGFAARLPSSSDVADAPLAAARDLAAAFPTHARALVDVAEAVRDRSARLGSILEHGDLWASNVLVEGGRISGVVDWDRWHPRGVPGTDVLQLFVATRRLTHRGPGVLILERVWEDPELARLSRPYWDALGVAPSRREAEAIGRAWWLGQIAAALRLGRQPATNPRWVERNIEAVLAEGA